VCENRVLRRILDVRGRKWWEDGEECIMRSSITCTLMSRRMRCAGYVTRLGAIRNANKILTGKPEWKRPLERPRHRWEGYIRTDLRETGWDGVDWIHLSQGRDQWRTLVSTVMILLFHKGREDSAPWNQLGPVACYRSA
jgi:hypothetical protein